MHFHPVPQEPGYTPAYCLDHAAEDEPMFRCEADFAWHRCVVCEEADFCTTCQARLEERAVVGCETFSLVMHDPESSLTWDIDKAWTLVNASPRAPRALPDEPTGFSFQGGEVDDEHLAHIPLEQREVPGLAVVLDNVEPDGTRQKLVVQIDGSHRSILAARAGRQRLVYLLTEQEQADCLMLYLVDGQPQPVPQLPGPAPTI